jgi:hypothetical protein
VICNTLIPRYVDISNDYDLSYDKTIANLREQQNTFEELVSKEKDRQHTVYLALLEVEGQYKSLVSSIEGGCANQ